VETKLDLGDRSEWIRVERDPALCELHNGDVGILCGWPNFWKKSCVFVSLILIYFLFLFRFDCLFTPPPSRQLSCIHAGDIQIPEHQQVVMDAATTYGLGIRCANTFWKAPGVYFHMHQTSSPYHVGAGRNRHFGAYTFFCQRCSTPYFWPIGPCIMLTPIWTHPRIGA
jgi:hypothetical protein